MLTDDDAVAKRSRNYSFPNNAFPNSFFRHLCLFSGSTDAKSSLREMGNVRWRQGDSACAQGLPASPIDAELEASRDESEVWALNLPAPSLHTPHHEAIL